MKSDSLYYIHKDYQGNIESITGEQGQLLESLSFDPWGRRRNVNTWEYDLTIKPQHFDRGYTMHEHYDVFGLINMNGRMYDPWVGRMLSPDLFIQDPTNLQNYNRYTYALNNPLKYVDPSGYHHTSVFKPGDWDAGMGSGGALYINAWFTNDFNHNPFGENSAANNYFDISYDQNGYLVENTGNSYWYHSTSGNYLDSQGNIVDFNEVFGNFIEPNSQLLPSNTDLNSIEAKDGGYQFFTIDPTSSPLWSSGTSEVNSHFINEGKGSAGGGVSGDNIFAKTYLHFQIGGGDPLTIDASTLNFGNISKSDLKNLGNGRYGLNLYDKNPTSQAAIALGKITLTDQGINQYSISPDYYDFNIEWQWILKKKHSNIWCRHFTLWSQSRYAIISFSSLDIWRTLLDTFSR